MDRGYRLTELESEIGYTFTNRVHLETALTHSSYVSDAVRNGLTGNEALEFLGDAVIELAVRDGLFAVSAKRGDLSLAADKIVRNQDLAVIGRSLRLLDGEPPLLLVGGSSRQVNDAGQVTLLAGAVEAIVGAVYCDAADKRVAIETAARLAHGILRRA